MIGRRSNIYGLGTIESLYLIDSKWIGKQVATFDQKGKTESRQVLSILKTDCRKVWSYRFQTANGNHITVTEDQKLLSAGGKRIKAKDIKIGTKLKCKSCRQDEVVRIEKAIEGWMFGLELGSEGNVFVSCNDFYCSF